MWVSVAACLAVATAALVGTLVLAETSGAQPPAGTAPIAVAGPEAESRAFAVSERQFEDLGVAAVESRTFVSRLVTDGRVAIDESRATPIYSPYAGRVTRLFARPGDTVARGQLLFTLESPDMVQGQNDFITAAATFDKATSQRELARTVEKRNADLYAAKAVPLKDWQQAQADLVAAESDLRSARIGLEAATNRLRILGRSDAEIEAFRATGRISPEVPIHAPLAGTVVQRKVGPGQYVTAGSNDPVFTVGDLSTVWLIANVRESDAGRVAAGQAVEFKVLAHPDRRFRGTIDYVAATVDPATRRLAVRCVIDNADGALKPEMFANVTILAGDTARSTVVPRPALIYEGDTARVWVVGDGRRLALRDVTLGRTDADVVEVVSGLMPGEKVVTRGNLFIDRAAKARAS